MNLDTTPIPDLFVAELMPLVDERGFFVRSFCQNELKHANVTKNIIQVNHSRTVKIGAIRGMHYQSPPYAEVKMVRCIVGSVFDVAIDLRHGSETFLKWYGEYLSQDNFKMMIIPEGFAHGFQVIKPNSELLYFHTAEYTPQAESGVLYNDERVSIEWPLEVTDLSDRDKKHLPIDGHFTGIKL